MSAQPAATPIRVGWATRDTTPERPVILRGQFHARISNEVHDPLTVTALALEADGQQCVMVSTDRVGIPEELLQGVRDQLSGSCPDLDPSAVFISATHTHTAPDTIDSNWEDPGPGVMKSSEYAAFFIQRTANCVAAAWTDRAAGALSWGCGQAVVGCNRRQVKLDSTSQMYGDTSTDDFAHIEGDADHGVDLLFTYDAQHALTGMVVNLACPSQVTESTHFISADFWHEARTEIRARHGQHLHVLPQCSAAGDQSPHLMLKKSAEARMLRLKGLYTEESELRLAERVDIGRRIATSVDEVLPLAGQEIHDQLPVKHQVATIQLPRRRITPDDVDEAKAEIAAYEQQLEALADRGPNDPERSRCFGRRRWFSGVVERFQLQQTQPTYPMELHILRLGDVVFATNSFELYLDYGQRIKARSPTLQTFVVQLAGAGTYLPTARSVSGGSYGSVPASNHVGPEGGDVLVEETLVAVRAAFE
jgi:hypothetical protein